MPDNSPIEAIDQNLLPTFWAVLGHAFPSMSFLGAQQSAGLGWSNLITGGLSFLSFQKVEPEELERILGFIDTAIKEIKKLDPKDTKSILFKSNMLLFFKNVEKVLLSLKSGMGLGTIVDILRTYSITNTKNQLSKDIVMPLIDALAALAGTDLNDKNYIARREQFLDNTYKYFTAADNRKLAQEIAGLPPKEEGDEKLEHKLKVNFVALRAQALGGFLFSNINNKNENDLKQKNQVLISSYIARDSEAKLKAIKALEEYMPLSTELEVRKKELKKLSSDLEEFFIEAVKAQGDNKVSALDQNIGKLFSNIADQNLSFSNMMGLFTELSSEKVTDSTKAIKPVSWGDYGFQLLVNLNASEQSQGVFQQLIIFLNKLIIELPNKDQAKDAKALINDSKIIGIVDGVFQNQHAGVDKELAEYKAYCNKKGMTEAEYKLGVKKHFDIDLDLEEKIIAAIPEERRRDISAKATTADRLNFFQEGLNLQGLKSGKKILARLYGLIEDAQGNFKIDGKNEKLALSALDIAVTGTAMSKVLDEEVHWFYKQWDPIINFASSLLYGKETHYTQLKKIAKEATSKECQENPLKFVRKLEKFLSQEKVHPVFKQFAGGAYYHLTGCMAPDPEVKDALKDNIFTKGSYLNILEVARKANNNIALLINSYKDSDSYFGKNINTILNTFTSVNVVSLAPTYIKNLLLEWDKAHDTDKLLEVLKPAIDSVFNILASLGEYSDKNIASKQLDNYRELFFKLIQSSIKSGEYKYVLKVFIRIITKDISQEEETVGKLTDNTASNISTLLEAADILVKKALESPVKAAVLGQLVDLLSPMLSFIPNVAFKEDLTKIMSALRTGLKYKANQGDFLSVLEIKDPKEYNSEQGSAKAVAELGNYLEKSKISSFALWIYDSVFSSRGNNKKELQDIIIGFNNNAYDKKDFPKKLINLFNKLKQDDPLRERIQEALQTIRSEIDLDKINKEYTDIFEEYLKDNGSPKEKKKLATNESEATELKKEMVVLKEMISTRDEFLKEAKKYDKLYMDCKNYYKDSINITFEFQAKPKDPFAKESLDKLKNDIKELSDLFFILEVELGKVNECRSLVDKLEKVDGKLRKTTSSVFGRFNKAPVVDKPIAIDKNIKTALSEKIEILKKENKIMAKCEEYDAIALRLAEFYSNPKFADNKLVKLCIASLQKNTERLDFNESGLEALTKELYNMEVMWGERNLITDYSVSLDLYKESLKEKNPCSVYVSVKEPNSSIDAIENERITLVEKIAKWKDKARKPFSSEQLDLLNKYKELVESCAKVAKENKELLSKLEEQSQEYGYKDSEVEAIVNKEKQEDSAEKITLSDFNLEIEITADGFAKLGQEIEKIEKVKIKIEQKNNHLKSSSEFLKDLWDKMTDTEGYIAKLSNLLSGGVSQKKQSFDMMLRDMNDKDMLDKEDYIESQLDLSPDAGKIILTKYKQMRTFELDETKTGKEVFLKPSPTTKKGV